MSDIGTDFNNAKNTLSSWDSCMSEAYCKWPVIVAIIVGSLILLSLLWCLAACVCCGAECCCGCLSCCRGCCPSRSRGGNNQGYQQPPQYPPYAQYQSQGPPMYNSTAYGGYGGAPQTATFDMPSKRPINDDSLPAMPSWGTAATRRVEVEDHEHQGGHDDAMEMEHLGQGALQSEQQQQLLRTQEVGEDAQGYGHHYDNTGASPGYESALGTAAVPAAAYAHNPAARSPGPNAQSGYQSPPPQASRMQSPVYGNNANNDYTSTYSSMAAANPYQDAYQQPQQQHQQQQQQPYQQNAPYQQQLSHGDLTQLHQQSRSPVSPIAAGNGMSPVSGYGPSIPRAPSSVYPSTVAASPPPPPPESEAGGYPPSYHSRPPSVLSPGNGGVGVNRRPVQGSWRDV